MAAEAKSNVTVSVDYTGRDYYAIREQLIRRVQDRIPDWQGSDPSDFGLALVEAFAYMGDLVNYYIDRIANESYLMTATQRENILNLANLFGYRPANYVSASTTLTLNSNIGYQGSVGGAIIEDGTIDSVTLGNYAKIIVPNDHPWTASDPAEADKYNRIRVSAVPSEASGTVGDTSVTYYTSVFNGTFPVANIGYDNIGKNVVWYRPAANVSAISIGTASITAATGDGTTVTYTAANEFVVGQIVTITGLGTGSGSSLNLSNVTVASATSTQFTVNNSTVGVSSGTGTATDTGFTVTLSETDRTLDPLSNQRIKLSGVTVGSGANYNGNWVILSSIPATSTTGTKIIVRTQDSFTAPKVTFAKVISSTFRYELWSDSALGQGFTTGQEVTVTGVNSANNTGGTAGSGFNLTAATIQAVKDVEAAVSRVKVVGSDVTYYVSKAFAADDLVTIRNIVSGLTATGAANAGFNLSNQTVSNTTATITAAIQNVVPNSADATITFETTADPDVGHGFKQNDYVTMTGIRNDVSPGVDRTDVYNLKSAKILAVGGGNGEGKETTFTVRGYWTNDYSDDQPDSPTATLYAFTLVGAGVTDTATSACTALSKYFDLTSSGTPGAWNTSTNAKATPVVGGTYSSGGEVVYSEIPTIVLAGPTATIVGSTLVPKGAQVGTQVSVEGKTVDVIFSTQSDVYVPYRDSAQVLATHGEDIALRTENFANTTAKPYDIAGELIGYSDGEPDQRFSIKEIEVAPRSIRVFIDTGLQWEEWLQVEHVQDYATSSKVFQVDVAANEEISVVFGDGVSGKIPPSEAGIKVLYVAGGGTSGNVSEGTLTSWKYIPGTNEATIREDITVTNSVAATGGTNPESNDSIRYNAPRALRALNRAVTLEDFAALALSVDGIVKANAYAESRSSVTVYIAPSAAADETTPGVDQDNAATPQMENYKTLVAQYLADKKQIGTTVTVLDPTYSYAHVDLNYSVLPQYNAGTVETSLKKELLDVFSYDNLDFQDVITPEEVEFKLRQVDGVSNVRVTGLYRKGGSGRNSLIGDPDEIFVFTGEEIGLNPTDTKAELSSVVFAPTDSDDVSTGSATLAPSSINGNVFTYTLTLPLGTTKLGFTVATNSNGKASVSINDNLAEYNGSNYTYTLTPIPLTTIVITVTAEDGITTNSYKFKTTISSS